MQSAGSIVIAPLEATLMSLGATVQSRRRCWMAMASLWLAQW